MKAIISFQMDICCRIGNKTSIRLWFNYWLRDSYLLPLPSPSPFNIARRTLELGVFSLYFCTFRLLRAPACAQLFDLWGTEGSCTSLRLFSLISFNETRGTILVHCFFPQKKNI